jgi:ATP-dependent Lon protease
MEMETVPDAEMEPEDQQPDIPAELNLLPLRDAVVFPMLIAPLAVGRSHSIQLVDDSVVENKRIIGVVAQHEPSTEKPSFDEVYQYGCAVVIRTMVKMADGVRLIVQGLSRFRIVEPVQEEPYLRARIQTLPEPDEPEGEERIEIEALRRGIAALFERAIALSPHLPDELRSMTASVHEANALTDLVAAHMPLAVVDKQKILETLPLNPRMRALMTILGREVRVLELSSKVQSEVTSELSKSQREYYLREQLRAIQKELGEGDDQQLELEELEAKIIGAKMSEEGEKECRRELDRLRRMSAGSPEYSVARTYIDWMVALPWSVATKDNLDLLRVKGVLDKDHYGLEKIKERILEFLAVRRFKTEGTVRQPILAFVGPPGTGKTSLGKSIARAMGRKFVRISLGGMRDEAEIRGHRRTYIGALPGQITQGLRRAGSNNPVFMLDEVDKLGADFRGDPSSALLEVLDPEQNHSFRDHYLDVDFDLSRVFFITTANILETIPPPLRDRMEMIELTGYTEEEKIQIAKRHLVPKQLSEHGLSRRKLRFHPSAIRLIISGHTREAGVRNLERRIAAVCRKATRRFAEGEDGSLAVSTRSLQEFLGPPDYLREEVLERRMEPGVAVGLAWTPVGGDILFIESTIMPGGKSLTLTGSLGDVMRESAQAALSYLRSNSSRYGIREGFYSDHDIHIHIPAGSIPKDGPSAGVAIAASLASLLSGRPLKSRLAMTGEITLHGQVLPVGGIKEKVLAAYRAGVRTVLLPERNEKDMLEDVPEEIREDMVIRYVTRIDEVLDTALDGTTEAESPGRRTESARKAKVESTHRDVARSA